MNWKDCNVNLVGHERGDICTALSCWKKYLQENNKLDTQLEGYIMGLMRKIDCAGINKEKR